MTGCCWPADGLAEMGDIRRFGRIIANLSGGKDGLVALRQAWLAASAAGVTDRLVAHYADLGKAVWPSTEQVGPHAVAAFGSRPGAKELAAEQAAFFGVPLVVTERGKDDGDGGTVDLFDEIEARGAFPSMKSRWCTSFYKRGPGSRLLTATGRQLRAAGRAPHILYVFGYRAQESRDRRGKVPFGVNADETNTARQVWDWYPVLGWSKAQVWACIHAHGMPYAWPYDAGMDRYSCVACVLAGHGEVGKALRWMPGIGARIARLEQVTGKNFTPSTSIHTIAAKAGVAL